MLLTSYGERGHQIFFNLLLYSYKEEVYAERGEPRQITMSTFMEYILLPELVNRLVAQDRQCNLEEANEVQMKSTDYGIHTFKTLEDDPIVL